MHQTLGVLDIHRHGGVREQFERQIRPCSGNLFAISVKADLLVAVRCCLHLNLGAFKDVRLPLVRADLRGLLAGIGGRGNGHGEVI